MEISDNFRNELLILLEMGKDEFSHRRRRGPEGDYTAVQHRDFTEHMTYIIQEYDLAILALNEPVLNFVIRPDE